MPAMAAARMARRAHRRRLRSPPARIWAGALARNAIQANSGMAISARTATSSSKPTPRWYSALPNSPLLANKMAEPRDEQHAEALAPLFLIHGLHDSRRGAATPYL